MRMSTEKTEAELAAELETLKTEIAELREEMARTAAEIDIKDLRRFLTQEAKRLGYDRDADLDELRAHGARAVRMARRNPGTAIGLAAAVGFCAGLLVVRR